MWLCGVRESNLTRGGTVYRAMHVLIPLFGWPGVLLSLAVMAAAFLANSYRLMFVGAFLSAPFLLYVSG